MTDGQSECFRQEVQGLGGRAWADGAGRLSVWPGTSWDPFGEDSVGNSRLRIGVAHFTRQRVCDVLPRGAGDKRGLPRL